MEDWLNKLGKVAHKFDCFLPMINGVWVKSDPDALLQPPPPSLSEVMQKCVLLEAYTMNDFKVSFQEEKSSGGDWA